MSGSLVVSMAHAAGRGPKHIIMVRNIFAGECVIVVFQPQSNN